jgi:hypothetical protein
MSLRQAQGKPQQSEGTLQILRPAGFRMILRVRSLARLKLTKKRLIGLGHSPSTGGTEVCLVLDKGQGGIGCTKD